MQNRRQSPSVLRPCLIFGGLVIVCVVIGAGVSYNRFSAPGAKADFQEGAKNPKFKNLAKIEENDGQSVTTEIEEIIFSKESQNSYDYDGDLTTSDNSQENNNNVRKSSSAPGTSPSAYDYSEAYESRTEQFASPDVASEENARVNALQSFLHARMSGQVESAQSDQPGQNQFNLLNDSDKIDQKFGKDSKVARALHSLYGMSDENQIHSDDRNDHYLDGYGVESEPTQNANIFNEPYDMGYGIETVSNNNNQAQNDHYLVGYGTETEPSQHSNILNEPYNVGYGEAYNYVANSNTASSLLDNNNLSNPSQLQCWTCNAGNWKECMEKGRLQKCEPNVTACQVTTRKRNGEYASVETGCKAAIACEQDKANNFVGGWNSQTMENQCRPDQGHGPSVCRQCCYSNNCNYNLDFMDQLGWDQTLN